MFLHRDAFWVLFVVRANIKQRRTYDYTTNIFQRQLTAANANKEILFWKDLYGYSKTMLQNCRSTICRPHRSAADGPLDQSWRSGLP